MAGVAPAHGWWPGGALVALWAALWALVWLRLPGGHLLRLLMPAVFFALAWFSLNADDDAGRRARRILAWVLLALCAWAGTLLLLKGGFSYYVVERFLMTWPLDLRGRDYGYAQVVKVWRSVQAWGPAFPDQPGVGLWGDVRLPQLGGNRLVHGTELLRIMMIYGMWAGTAVAVGVLLAWWALWRWVRRVPPSPWFSAGARRFTLALVFLHAAAAWAYVLFNMGVLRQNFWAGFPPVSTLPAWWPLSAALLVMLGFAARGWWAGRTTASGKSGWVTALGYALAGTALGLELLLAGDLLRTAVWNQLVGGQ